MKILRLFHKSKKEKEEKVETGKESPKPLELKVFCGDNVDVYNALEETYPMNILSFPNDFLMEETLEKAREKEKSGDLYSVGLEYRIAGQIALCNGDIEGVRNFFGKAQKLTGKRYLILGVVLKSAVEKAQKYHQEKKKEKEEEEERKKKNKSVQI